MKNNITIASVSLFYREGGSDKVYHTSIEPKDDGYVVNFAYGRRGSTLTTGTKTPAIVSLQQAHEIHRKLVASKTAKGYQLEGGAPAAYEQTGDEGRDTGVRCQLLNPVDEKDLRGLLDDNRHCLQEKHDGRRMLVAKQGGEVIGINRRGLVIALPDPIRLAVEELPVDVLIDGEAVGEILHAFDLLELKGQDMRDRPYLHRYAGLLTLLDPEHRHLRPVSTITHPADKQSMFDTFRQAGSEGVVFKDMEAPFQPGRSASGGSQLKYKFVESASFVVIARNAKRSVGLGLFNGSDVVGVGNVTIPPNHEVPAKGEVVEVRYLYAFRESGFVYQPVYMGKRSDIPADECVTDQLKYKTSQEIAA